MAGPLIHIGYNKTGSTWLQEVLLPRRDFGFGLLLDLQDRKRINRQVVKQHSLRFSGDAIRAYYEERVAAPERAGLLPVISCERFSGDPHSGGYDNKEIADRLYKLWPDARILMVVREQQSMLLSTYRQYVRAGGPRSLQKYFHPPERGSRRVPSFDPDLFCYDYLAAYYQELFGRDRVLILPYEWLRRQPVDYVRRILAFCELEGTDEQIQSLALGRQVNRGYGRLTLAAKRVYNRFFLENSLNPAARISFPNRVENLYVRIWRGLDSLLPRAWQQRATKRMQKYILRETGHRYGDSNRRLALLSGLPLQELGYKQAEPETIHSEL